MEWSAGILLSAVFLVGVLFVGATWSAVRKRGSPGKRDVAIAAGLFAAVVLVDLGLARAGVLSRFDSMPPRFAPFFLFNVLGLSFAVAFSPLGTLVARFTPVWGLVAFQAFRVLAELTIFTGVHEGRAPVQLSFEGYNFDIVTAVSAAVLGVYLRGRSAPRVALAWNVMGCGFLAAIAFIAMASMPSPLRLFHGEPSNAWVTTAPYVLLPGVLVVAALTGHLLLFRKLAMERRAIASTGQ